MMELSIAWRESAVSPDNSHGDIAGHRRELTALVIPLYPT